MNRKPKLIQDIKREKFLVIVLGHGLLKANYKAQENHVKELPWWKQMYTGDIVIQNASST